MADASPRAWLEGYAGYLHVAPRVLASLAAILPIDLAPLVLSGGAALAAGALALSIYRAAETQIPERMPRAVLAVCLLTSPAAGIEVANVAANIHWYLPFAISWLALGGPIQRLQVASGSAILFLAAASDPFAILVAPILAWRVRRAARRTDVVLILGLGAGIALQAWGILSSSGSRPVDPLATSAVTLAKWYGFHVLETSVFGIVLRDALLQTLGVAASGALAVGMLAFLLVPAARAAKQQPSVPAILVGLHLGFYFLPVMLAGVSTPRYAVTPILLLYALIAWGLTKPPGRNWPQRWIATILLAIVTVVDFAPWNPRADGPRWSQGLAQARAICSAGRVDNARVPIPPNGLPPEDPRRSGSAGYWTVVVPCGYSGLASNER